MITSYREYLLSKEWKAIAMECKRLAGNKCNRCDSTENLHAHHKTYDNIYNEKQEDLECLCTRCHNKEHGKKSKRIIPYRMIGVGIGSKIMKEREIKPRDLLEEMAEFTKPEMFLFILLKRSLSWDCESTVARVQSKFLNGTEKQYVKKGYKLLYEKDIVRRVKRGTYMINPAMIIPLKEEEQIDLWNSLEPHKTKQERKNSNG